jgi:hypothetical protein
MVIGAVHARRRAAAATQRIDTESRHAAALAAFPRQIHSLNKCVDGAAATHAATLLHRSGAECK